MYPHDSEPVARKSDVMAAITIAAAGGVIVGVFLTLLLLTLASRASI